jgi:hypothetical protein
VAIPAGKLEAKNVNYLERLTALKANNVLLGPLDRVTNATSLNPDRHAISRSSLGAPLISFGGLRETLMGVSGDDSQQNALKQLRFSPSAAALF